MSAPERDQELVQRCLRREAAAWRQFVDQFLPLFYHVVEHCAEQHPVHASPEDVEDVVADVLASIVEDNFRVLRQYEGKSKLSTYLVVVARRMALRALRTRWSKSRPQPLGDGQAVTDVRHDWRHEQRRPETIEEIRQVLRRLPRRLRLMVRMYYLEGRTYQEISAALNIPINTIGPALTRARRLLWQSLNPGQERSASRPPASQDSQTHRTDEPSSPSAQPSDNPESA
ncbi:MAG: sigma-70 family RNA polymerase sigma factor [Gemmatales bacterium]|nr:sigma-70 family RNA polymerase sigma factor [Gemmatales bacterium]MDW8174495.1 sigma-70 family RNA polymerase sigma factor [Gemmatales bacterium]